MGETTGISWTDATFNPWHGCTEVSPGCDNCYARTLNQRWGEKNWGKGVPRKTMSEHYWNDPLRWDRKAAKEGVKKKVFCASMCDIMDDEAPAGERERLWALIDKTPNLVWQLLTKRPQRYARYLPKEFKHNNVWYGATAENQEFFDIRYPIICELSIQRGGVNWISYEPALGPLSIIQSPLSGFYYNVPPDWVIFGGESGHKRRPMERKWVEDLKRECEQNHVALFVKQFSALTPTLGKELMPANLLIREFP